MGSWRDGTILAIGLSRSGNYDGSPVNLSLQVAGYKKELKPGESIETPKAFTGVFAGDLDAMGNLLLDWQYEYLWDLTNPDYFAKTRWAVDWPSPWVGDGRNAQRRQLGKASGSGPSLCGSTPGNRRRHSVG